MKTTLMLAALLMPALSFAQKGSTSSSSAAASTAGASHAFIDVSASSQREVEPDLVYVVFTLRQKTESKVVISIPQQLDRVKYAFQNTPSEITDFQLEKDGADMIKVLPPKKDDPAPQSFILKITEADKVKSMLKTLDSLGAQEIRVTHIGYTKVKELEKEMRIEAVKYAKEKSDYMLSELGATTGKIIWVYEDGAEVEYGDGPDFHKYPGENASGGDNTVSFKGAKIPIRKDNDVLNKIKYEFTVVIRFEVK